MLLNVVALTFALSFGLTLALEVIARRFGIVSKTSYRRKKVEHTPLLGGLAVLAAATVGFLLVDSSTGSKILLAYLPLLVFAIGDDLREFSGRWKLTAQLACAIAWLALVPKDNLYFNSLISEGTVASALTLAFIIGTTNAFNLIDGLDGQATILAMITWGALSLTVPETPAAWIMIAALGGFLIRNFHPARIYLGEVGGSFIGFSLGAMATLKPSAAATNESFIALLFLFSLPFADTVAAIARRLIRGHSVFHGDREHVHHRLQKLQLNVPQTLFITASLGLSGAMTFVLSSRLSSTKMQWTLFATSGLLMSVIFLGILYFERVFSQRVLGMGRGLLQKRLAGHFHEGLSLAPTRAILIDLLPYFRELQTEGVLTLHDFLDDLAAVVTGTHARRVEFIGSYSVALFFDDAITWDKNEIQVLSARFYELFRKYHCVRGLSAVPEGISFCAQNRIPTLLSVIEAPVGVEEKAAS